MKYSVFPLTGLFWGLTSVCMKKVKLSTGSISIFAKTMYMYRKIFHLRNNMNDSFLYNTWKWILRYTYTVVINFWWIPMKNSRSIIWHSISAFLVSKNNLVFILLQINYINATESVTKQNYWYFKHQLDWVDILPFFLCTTVRPKTVQSKEKMVVRVACLTTLPQWHLATHYANKNAIHSTMKHNIKLHRYVITMTCTGG